MDIPRELRKELDQLSKEVFGVSSRWQKILKEGVQQLLTKTVTETVPGGDGGPDSTKTVQVPILTDHGAKQIVTKRFTLEEVHAMLLDYKKQVDAFRAAQKAQREEQLKKQQEEQLLKAVQEAANGSAVV